MIKQKELDLLKTHLNVSWLRPENVVWDTALSVMISKYKFSSPSLDLGCGNGIFSFITAGGGFSTDFDWYVNVDTDGFWANKDIYNAKKNTEIKKFITKQPSYTFSFGLDHKPNLLSQAKELTIYEKLIEHDANFKLPFEDAELRTIFSNILYWLNDPPKCLAEIYRVLNNSGIAILCIPTPQFYEYCISFRWKEKKSALLKKLNRGRSETLQWVASHDELRELVKTIGFKIVDHKYYVSKLSCTLWDIGLRPLSPILIKMSNSLDARTRRTIKSEWMDTMMEILVPLYEMENKSREIGGFQLVVLSK
jgi:SAM-dependent methyltransferase